MPAEGVPSLGWDRYLTDCIPAVQEKYRGRNKRIKDIRDRRLNLVGPKIPKNFKNTAVEFRAPLVRQLIRASQALMAVRMPIPKRIPLSEKPSDQDASSEIEKKLSAIYRRTLYKEDWYGQVTDALAADGEATWKLNLRRSAWGQDMLRYQDDAGEYTEDAGDYNKRTLTTRRKNFPLAVEHVASETYYPLAWDDDGATEVLEVTFREPQALAHQYGLSPKDGKLIAKAGYGPVTNEKYGKSCRYTEYRNATHLIIMVDGVVVEEIEHDLGAPDYFHVDFSVSSIKDPTYATESIAEPLLRLQDAIEAMITYQGNWAFLAGMPVATLEPVNEDAIPEYDQGTVIKWEPGGTVQPPLGYRWRWADPPAAGQDLTQVREFLMEMSDRVSLAPILQGQSEQRMSATTAATLIAVGKSVFGPGLMNLGRGFDHMAGRILYICENVLQAPIPLWIEDTKGGGTWYELDPDEVGGYYEVFHNLAPVIPMEQMQKAVLLKQGHDDGAVTMRRYREEGFGIEDPDQEDKEVWIERLEEGPVFQNAISAAFQEDIKAEMGGGAGGQTQVTAAVQQALMGIQQALIALAGPQQGTPPTPSAGMAGPGAAVVPGMGGRPPEIGAPQAGPPPQAGPTLP